VIDAETEHLAVYVAVGEKRLVSLEKAGFWSKNGIRGRWTDEYREVGQHPAGTLGLPLGGNHSDPRIKLSGRCAAIPKTQAAEGREPPLAATLALLALVGQRCTIGGGVRASGAWVDTDDAGNFSHMIHGQDDEAARKGRPSSGEQQKSRVQ
jgi:hypothetical protein